jgi:hypothetical protein
VKRRCVYEGWQLSCDRPVASDEKQHLPALLRGFGPVQDNIFGFILAGFETTALGAAWAIYLLALFPKWQRRSAWKERTVADMIRFR